MKSARDPGESILKEEVMMSSSRNDNLLIFGTKCNNNCLMCVNSIPSEIKQPTKKEIIENIGKGFDSISISGGDPTIREYYFDVLKFVRDNMDARVTVVTNGRKFFYRDFCRKNIGLVDKVVTEIHGDEILHDRITRVKGSFWQTFRGIINLLDMGFDVELRVLVHKLNVGSLNKITRIYLENFPDAGEVVFLPVDFRGNAFYNKDKLAVSYSDMTPMVEQELNFLDEHGMRVGVSNFPHCFLSKRFWGFSKKDDRGAARMPVCRGCRFTDECAKPWKSYVDLFGMGEFEKQ